MSINLRNTWLVGITFACACNQSDPVLPSEAEDPMAEAIQIAQTEVDQQAGLSETDGWTSASRVVEAYPIHGAGRDRVSYYEAKVVTGGQDSGYVLVNVDKTDLLVPESATEGRTLTESYREKLGLDDLRVVRYDWFRSAAFNPAGQMLTSRGFEGESNPSAAMDRVATAARANGVFPAYSQGAVSDYYDSLKAQTQAPATGDIEATTQAISTREFTAELKHTFKSGWHTPQWTQFFNAVDYPIGCGPTAWAMLYAYWRQFKGAGRLFEGEDLQSHSDEWGSYDDKPGMKCMEACANVLGTEFVISQGKKVGRTYPWDMCKGTKYASDRAYPTTCTRDRGTEYSKFDKVYDSLNDDRPAILLIGADEKDHWGNHYVVIEAARKTQQKWAFNWHDRNVSYLVNWGHGTIRKWIYVRDWGKNQHDVYASFSVFLVNLTVPANHGGSAFAGHDYKFFNQSKDWLQAERACKSEGGHLVSISSSEENEFVRGLIPSGVIRAWIGLTKQTGSWRWSDNRSPSYTNWNEGEPNSATSNELYTEMRQTGRWNDLPNWSVPYICEWE